MFTFGAFMVLSISTYIWTTNGDPFTGMANPNFISSSNLNIPMSGPSVIYSPNLPMNQAPFSQSSLKNRMPITAMSSSMPDIAVPDVVKTFASNFIRGIEQDQTVKNAFAYQRLTADEVEALTYDIVYKDHTRVGGIAPEVSAHMVAESMKQNYEYAVTEAIIRLFAYVVGKDMFYHGLLSPDNAIDLSQQYVEKIRNNVNSVIEHTPEADIRAMTKGFMEFISSFNLYRKDNAPAFAAYFTNQVNGIKQFNSFI